MANNSREQKADKKKPAKFQPMYNCNDFLLRMITDKKTEMYVKFAKIMVMCQGPYTALRKGAVLKIPEIFKTCSCLISDDTFCQTIKKPCRYDRTEEYYTYFQNACKEAIELANNLIVLNPTMSNVHRNRVYMALAYKMKYVFFVAPPFITKTSNKPDWEIHSQAYSFRETGTFIPGANMFQHLFCAFYLHDSDSQGLRREGSLYAKDCIENISEFRDLFSLVCPDNSFDCEDKFESEESCKKMENTDLVSSKCTAASFSKYFNLNDDNQDLVFAVVKIFHNIKDIQAYFNKEEVLEHYGKMSKLLIVGFIVSPCMIAARVKLTHYQKPLWDIEDDLLESNQNEVAHLVCPSELVKQVKSELPEIDVKLVGSRTNPTLVNTGKYTYAPTDLIHDYAKGRSCHLVLGKAPGASRHNIDYDVAFALTRERNSKNQKVDIEIIDLEKCQVKRLGKFWFIYLKELLSIDSFLATCCKPFPYEQAIK